jgi:hypothetical protein
MTERFPKCLVLVVSDFRKGFGEVLALRTFGARVLAAGLGSAAVKRRLEECGVGASGIERSKRSAAEAAALRAGGCDAVLFAAGAWEAAIHEVRDAEQQAAIADGRRMIPLLDQSDKRYRFLRTPKNWALFTLARAAGADFEAAREFATERKRGHQKKDPVSGRGRRNRPATHGKQRGAQRSNRLL